jgi:hypothetical protein
VHGQCGAGDAQFVPDEFAEAAKLLKSHLDYCLKAMIGDKSTILHNEPNWPKFEAWFDQKEKHSDIQRL